MDEQKLRELCDRKRQQYIKLTEVSDLTRQLEQALRQRDQVSIEMLLTMRGEPLQNLTEMENALRELLLTFPEQDAIRAAALLRGEAANHPSEEALCKQVGQYQRLLQQIIALDRQLNTQLGGKHSFYATFRN